MDLRDAAQKGYDDGYDGRHESELTVETMFHDLVGLGDEVEDLKHAYAFAYGRGVARRQYDDGELGAHDLNDFMSGFLPFGDWSGLSEVAHEGYHDERESLNDKEREREEEDDETDKIDPEDGGSGGSGGGGDPFSWRDVPLLAAFLLLFTRAGLIFLGVIVFLTVGYCQHQARPDHNAQPSALIQPATRPPTEEPAITSAEPEVQIDMLALFEGVDAEYQPLATAPDVLEINGRYGSPVREGIAAGFRFSGARSGETRFRAEIWAAHGQSRKGVCIPDRRLWRASTTSENWVASAEEGNFVCAYQGPMLLAGDYRVHVFVDEGPQQSLDFRVVPKRIDSESPQVIGFGNREMDKIRLQLEREAYEQERAQQAAFMQEYQDAVGRNSSCYQREELCEVAYREHRAKGRQASEDRIERVRQIRRMTDEELLSISQSD
ncbi:hypothetical protein [Sphingomonas sp.]|jgi:hypothetical protein|uniref:hypothetical protein n=1 Tax=Sphingomonas sp. TaxID=28214 RepID=UPI002ED8A72E